MLNYEQLLETVLESTTLRYMCDSGLSLTGPDNITCTNEGQWSSDPENIMCLGKPASCIRAVEVISFSFDYTANCTVPSEPANGKITALYTDGTVLNYEQLLETVLEGTVLNYQCDSGYFSPPSESITCNSMGIWNVNPEQIMCSYGIIIIYTIAD